MDTEKRVTCWNRKCNQRRAKLGIIAAKDAAWSSADRDSEPMGCDSSDARKQPKQARGVMSDD